MSRLGKIGLFLNVALALFFAVWGFGVYSNRMDWKAESKERQDQLRKLGDALKKTVTEVETTRPQYAQQDARRPILDKWYADQLESLRSGKGVPKELVYKKGVLQYDAQGLPQLAQSSMPPTSLSMAWQASTASTNSTPLCKNRFAR